ncbi:uncharacterized protein LOC135370081 isoform X2 [Ornithodoros turicata]
MLRCRKSFICTRRIEYSAPEPRVGMPIYYLKQSCFRNRDHSKRRQLKVDIHQKVEEPDYSSLHEEDLRNLLEDLASHRPKESSLLAQRLLDGVRDPDDTAPHGVLGGSKGLLRGPARRRTPIPSHRSLQDLPALQHDGMRSAGLGRSRPGRAVRAHSLSDQQDFGNEVAIEMVPLTSGHRSEEELDRRNGTSEEEKEEDGRSKSCSLVLTKLFPLQPMERTKAFLCGSDVHMSRPNNYQEPHNSHVRKGKKARAVEDKLLAKNMEGNCGDLPIERLLEFICSGDKQRSKTSNNTKVKNPRKLLPKVGTSRNKDDLAEDLVNNNFVDSRISLIRGEKLQDEPTLPSGGTPERSLSPSFYSDQGIDGDGSYRVDVSSFSDVDQIHEECEFRVVTKKHRRKMQPKKVCDNFRQTPYYQPPFKKKNEDETGRRAGSAPHSDQSSPENSDLDSVHSLPVRGATTSQTSYADIARMSCARRNFYSPEDATVVPSLPASQDSLERRVSNLPKKSCVYTECPAVVIMDGQEGSTSALGEITFGFDVNEQLLRMTLEDVFVPSVRDVSMGAPHFEDPPDDVGRFNYRDVVDFLDCAWNRAYQSYERDMASGEKTDNGCLRTLYYCDGQRS